MLVRNCNFCENVLRATSVTTAGNVVFVTSSTITPKNGCKYILKVPCSLIPTIALTTVEQVFIQVNGVNIPLQCKLGNNVYSDQVKCFNRDNCSNIVLRLVYGSTPSHFKLVCQDLPFSTAYGTTGAFTAPETTTDTVSTVSTQSAKASSTPKA